jgi:hypothetical protein
VFPMSAADLQEWLNSVSISDWTWEERNGEVHASKLHPAKPLDYLYQYLIASEFIIPMPATKD